MVAAFTSRKLIDVKRSSDFVLSRRASGPHCADALYSAHRSLLMLLRIKRHAGGDFFTGSTSVITASGDPPA
jgi:hypothetical protein